MLNQHPLGGTPPLGPSGKQVSCAVPTLEHEQAGQEKQSRSKADDTLAGNNGLLGATKPNLDEDKGDDFPYPPLAGSQGVSCVGDTDPGARTGKVHVDCHGGAGPLAHAMLSIKARARALSSELEVTRKILQPCFGPGTRYRSRPWMVLRATTSLLKAPFHHVILSGFIF